jgi:uncharacterized membrane protein YfcA
MISVHVFKLVAFGFLGFAISDYLPLMIAMIATGAVGNWLGEEALARTSEQRFRLLLKIFVTILALDLVWRALREGGII